MALPLDETIVINQNNHLQDHNDIHDVVNEAARINTVNAFTSEQRALRIVVKEHPTDVRHPDFGADPTGVANSASAIQSALTYVGNAGTIFVPGTYNLGTTGLNLVSTQRIIGAGQEESKLVYTGTGAAIRVGDGSGVVTERAVVAHLTLDGSNTGAYGLKLGAESGSPLSGCGYFEDLYITRFATAGIWLCLTAFSTFSQVTSSVNTGDGLLVKKGAAGSYSTTTEFMSCKFRQNIKRGALFKDYDSIHFTMCTFELNGEEGVLIERENDAGASTNNLLFDMPYFELNNYNRSGTTHAQFVQNCLGNSLVQATELRNPRFGVGDASNSYHLDNKKGELVLYRPFAAVGGSVAKYRVGDTSVAWTMAVTRYNPTVAGEWSIGGTTSPVTVYYELGLESSKFTNLNGVLSPVDYRARIEDLKPAAALYETIPRANSYLGNIATTTSGKMWLQAINLPAGVIITSITFRSGNVAATTPTNQWFAIYDSARNLLRQTTDDTTTAWATQANKTLTLTSTFKTTYSGLHYLGVMVAAATPNNLNCAAGSSGINGLAPILTGLTSDTGLTTTAPATSGAIAPNGSILWAYVS